MKLKFNVTWILGYLYGIFNKIILQVIEVIYPLGDITDPVTGKKVVASQYR